MWKDTTGYSQGGDKTPNCWTMPAGDLRITVTSGHIAYRGTGMWIMHCRPFFDTHELPDAKTAEEAQAMAIKKVRAKLQEAVAAFDRACG